MLLDTVFLVLLLGFMGLGAWRGAIATGVGLVSIILSYAAAVVAATALGDSVADWLVLPSLLGPAVAGSLGFLAMYLIASSAGAVLRAWDRARVGEDSRGPFDRLSGAFFGALRGGLIVVLLSLLFSWLDAGRDMDAIAGFDALPQTEQSRITSAASVVVEKAVSAAMSSEIEGAARIAGRLVARPGQFLGGVQALVDDPKFKRVIDDKFFWTLVSNGAGDRAINRGSFYEVSHDPEMRKRFVDLGLVDAKAAGDPKVFRREVAVVLNEVGTRIKGLKDDPELLAMASDPEIVQLVQNGDTMALIRHPRIQRLSQRIAKRSAAPESR